MISYLIFHDSESINVWCWGIIFSLTILFMTLRCLLFFDQAVRRLAQILVKTPETPVPSFRTQLIKIKKKIKSTASVFCGEKLKGCSFLLECLKMLCLFTLLFDLFHVSSCFLPLILALESGKKAVALRFEVGHSRVNAPPHPLSPPF